MYRPPRSPLRPAPSRLLLALLVAAASLAPGARPLTAQPAAPSPDEAGSFWQRETLTGTWSGLRSGLEAHGLRLDAGVTSDLFAGVAGGVARGAAHLYALHLSADVDLGTLAGWRGARLLASGFGTFGESPSTLAGDLQAVSNIDAPEGWRLYEAYVEQALFTDRLSIRAGLYDLNGEFYAAETAALFLNGAHGAGPELSLSGRNGPSFFPFTTLGLRARLTPSEHLYVQLAVLDGVPCGPENRHLFPVHLAAGEGVLLAAEAGRRKAAPDAGPATPGLALGAWAYSRPADGLAGASPSAGAASFGAYGFAEHTLFRVPGAPARRLDLYVRAGYARAAVNPVVLAWGGGLVLTGPAAGRPDDQLGLAVSAAHGGHPYLQAQRHAGAPLRGAEVAFELTYRLALGAWLVLQPDVQYVFHPAHAPGVPGSLVVGQRLALSL